MPQSVSTRRHAELPPRYAVRTPVIFIGDESVRRTARRTADESADLGEALSEVHLDHLTVDRRRERRAEPQEGIRDRFGGNELLHRNHALDHRAIRFVRL